MIRWWRWLLVPLFILMGMGFSYFFDAGWLTNPVLYARMDVARLIFLIGLGFAFLAAVWAGLWHWFERARMEASLEVLAEAAQDRRRFLRRLDHEMKNPLTAIQAGLANLNGSDNDEALESVRAQTLRLSRLVADLRKLAELETRPLEETPINMGEVLQDAVDFAQEQPQSNERHLSLNVPQAPWPLPVISGDRDLLFLAVHNLLNNALKFTQPGDTVEVRAFEDGDRVVVEVADTGPGIPDEEQSQVWKELYRGKGARGIPGSGLGLALVRAITERHGGEVTLRSRAGQGTVVSVRLPSGDVTNL